MKQDKDWTDLMRSALRDAELPPPAGGWERLQRELGAAAAKPAVPAARKPAWRIHIPRIAAAAAVAALFFAAGGYLFRPDEVLKQGGTDVASVAGPAAADMPQRAEPESVQELLAQQVGLPRERTAQTSSSIRRQSLLAAAQPEAGRSGHTAEERAAALREPDITGASARTRALAERFAEEKPTAERTAEKDSAAEQPAGKQAVTEQAGGNDAAATESAGEASRTSSAPAAGRAAQRSATRSAGTASARTAFSDEPFVAYTPPRKTASFSLFAGGGVTGGGNGVQGGPLRYSDVISDLSSIVGNGDNMSLLQRNDEYGESSFRHHQALSFGLAVRKEFAHGLSLESGVNYTLLRSDVRAQYASDDVSQKLHFIGVPLRLNWQFFERGRFSLYIGAGGQVEKCVSAKFGSRSMDEPGVQWSALAAAGAQYRIGTTVGLYFEPEGSYYFTQTALRTARTDSPLTLTLRLGVRLSF